MGGKRACAPHHQTPVKFRDLRSCIFVSFKQITFKLGSVSILRRSFQCCRLIFQNLSMSKVEKNRDLSTPPHTLSPPYKPNIEIVHTKSPCTYIFPRGNGWNITARILCVVRYVSKKSVSTMLWPADFIFHHSWYKIRQWLQARENRSFSLVTGRRLIRCECHKNIWMVSDIPQLSVTKKSLFILADESFGS